MKKVISVFIFSLFIGQSLISQYTFGTNIPQPNSIMTIQTIDSAKGVKLPIVTKAKLTALPVNASMNGMLVYDITDSCYKVCNGVYWDCITQDTSALFMTAGEPPYTVHKSAFLNGDTIVFTPEGSIGIGTMKPTNKLHITNLNPVRFDSIQYYGSASVDSLLVLTSDGVLKRASTKDMGIITQDSAEWIDAGSYVYARRAAENGDTVIIADNGRVGVGTTSPSAKLDVEGTFKLVDGTEGAGKFLVSDANGNASWTNIFGTSWTDVTGSRAFNTTYTNNTGKPLYVSISLDHNGGVGSGFSQFFIDGLGMSVFVPQFGWNVFYHSFIVPVGSTYVLSVSGAVPLLVSWNER